MSQVIAAAQPILLVPLFLRAWGADEYGRWLVLTALVSYFSLLDFGGQNYIGNLLAIDYAQGKKEGFREKLSEGVSLFIFIALVVLILLVIVLFGLMNSSLPVLGNLLSTKECWIILFLGSNWSGSVETYCRSTVEAQAAGVPVVGAKRGSLPEVVQDGVTGALIDRPNPVMLGKAIVSLLSDRELRQRIGRTGKEWIRPKSDYALLAQDWEAIARRAQSGGPAPTERLQVSDLLRSVGYGQARLWAKRLI